MFHHFCWPPSISLNFSVAAVLLRWDTLALAFHRLGWWCPSLTAWTTRVSNPVGSPRFRFSVAVHPSYNAFALERPH